MQTRTEREEIEHAAYKMVEKNDSKGIQQAVEKNPWLLRTSIKLGGTLLHTACWENNAKMVEQLINLKADVNYDQFDGPPISTAIFKKASLETITLLLQNKANLNYGGAYPGPLYWASVNCDYDVVEALLKAGARYRGGEVLQGAISQGDEAFVDMLTANGISVNSKDNWNNRPVLTWAGCNGSDERHYRIAKKLLEKKADVNATDKYGQTPLFWAVSGDKTHELTALYLEYGAKIDAVSCSGETPLLLAAERGNLVTVQMLMKRASRADIEHKDKYGKTLLHYGAINGESTVCSYLLDKGLDINAKDHEEMTPLACAFDSSRHSNMLALLKAGADANIRNEQGETLINVLKQRQAKDGPDYHDYALKQCLQYLEIMGEKSKEIQVLNQLQLSPKIARQSKQMDSKKSELSVSSSRDTLFAAKQLNVETASICVSEAEKTNKGAVAKNLFCYKRKL